MKHYTKFALIGALPVVIFVFVQIPKNPDVASPPVVTEPAPTSATYVDSVPTTTEPIPSTTEATTTVPVAITAPGCATWQSQADAQKWMDASPPETDTSGIDTNGDGRPCTAYFAPPPPPKRVTTPPTTHPPTTVPATPTAPTGSVESTIRAAAAEFGVSGNLLVRIARCESTLNPQAVNRSSGALGLFQHLPRFWSGRAARLGYDYGSWSSPSANARVSAQMIAQGGTSPWNASRSCWG